MVDSALAALSFLTRFGRAKVGAPDALAASLPWFGPVGLFIGFCCLCASLICAAIAPPGLASIQWQPLYLLYALAWLACEIWLSRGMHWDGVADIGDAAGSGAVGARFHAILKDSRAGAFGVLALLLVFSGQMIAISLHFGALFTGASLGPVAGLLLAPAWGRIAPIWLAWRAKPYRQPSLGAILCNGVTKGVLAIAISEGAICLAIQLAFGLQLRMLAALMLAQMGLLFYFRRLGEKNGGLSGDFFGCLIEASQLLYLLATIF